MDLKHEVLYRDDVLLVKTEPRLQSPLPTSSSLLAPNSVMTANHHQQQQNNGMAPQLVPGSSTVMTSNGLTPSNNGYGGNASGGAFSSIGATPGGGTKRPRPDEWLSSPSPGNVSVSGPPLTPSPGPQSYTVISNGYSSPMSSGSYDPYSPNGKIGKSSWITYISCWSFIREWSAIVHSFYGNIHTV